MCAILLDVLACEGDDVHVAVLSAQHQVVGLDGRTADVAIAVDGIHCPLSSHNRRKETHREHIQNTDEYNSVQFSTQEEKKRLCVSVLLTWMRWYFKISSIYPVALPLSLTHSTTQHCSLKMTDC